MVAVNAVRTERQRIYFPGCVSETCYNKGYYGFKCHKDGTCDRICLKGKCWDSIPSVFHDKAKPSGLKEGFFDGCKTEVCRKNGFTGYGCHKVGMCDSVCRKGVCWSPKVKPVPVSGPNKDIAKQSPVHFNGCKTEVCKKSVYVGYNCVDGKCDFVCKGDSCKTQPKQTTLEGLNWDNLMI